MITIKVPDYRVRWIKDDFKNAKQGVQSLFEYGTIDIKEALYHFGMITGQVTNDELLGNIFANFCIGK